MTTASYPTEPMETRSGPRPVNLRTDLGPLADLIELVFANSMDDSGRAAIREMRYLSKLGAGLNMLTRLNELALGISLGYVWVEDDRLVGNVSLYPANWPKPLGPAWIIANVGTHPDYQRRGIARRLMLASLDLIRQKGGRVAILQVDDDNHAAKRLYEELGFITERTWTTWRLNATSGISLPDSREPIFITRARPNEWSAEYALAQLVRPQERGGIGWLKPLHQRWFKTPLWKRVMDWLSFGGIERLIIRSQDGHHILASLWVERVGLSNNRLTLMVHPNYQGLYDAALLGNVLRRSRFGSYVIEHPSDETATADVLRRLRFSPRRIVNHMRLDL